MSFVPWRNENTDERGNFNHKYDGINHDKEQQRHGKPLPPGAENAEDWVVIEDTFFAVVAATVPWLAKDACLTPKADMTDGYIGTRGRVSTFVHAPKRVF